MNEKFEPKLERIFPNRFIYVVYTLVYCDIID